MTNAIEPEHLKRVERWTLVLGALVSGASFLALPRPMAAAAAVGALLMCGNAASLRALTARVTKSRGGATPGIGVVLFNFKMGLLVALVWIALRVLHLDGTGFLLGISVFPVAIVAAALSVRLERADDPPHASDTTTPATPPISGGRA